MRNAIKSALILFIFLLLLNSCSHQTVQIPKQEQDFCSSIHRNDSTSLSKELDSLTDLMKSKTGVHVLEDGTSSIVTRAWLSEYAEKNIDVQYFIFSLDNVGLIACDYLVRAADRGVKVRMLVDDIMVEAGAHEILTMASHKNITIKIYNPGINLGKNILQKLNKLRSDFRGANQRMHNKTFIVDGKILITGGRNIADEYFDYDHEYNFRDRDVLLLGKGSKQAQKSFDEFWNSPLSVNVSELIEEPGRTFDDSARFDRLHQYACNPDNFWPQVREKIKNIPTAFKKIQSSGKLIWTDSVSFISDSPGKNERKKGLRGSGICTDTLINLIKKAKSSIEIQSPYLITTNWGLKLFSEAIQRGVKIRILTNSLASTDNIEAFAGYQKCRKQLLKIGIKIFEFKPNAQERIKIMNNELQEKLEYTPTFALHAKSMIIDQTIAVVGTFNLDPRSANLNTECVTIIRSKKIATSILEGMEVEFLPENSWETTQQFNPDSEAKPLKRINSVTKRLIPKRIL